MKKLLLACLFLLPASPALAASPIGQVEARGPVPDGTANIRLTVLHTNDMHGWISPKPDRKDPDRLVGGAATLVNAVRKFRKQDPAVLVVDTGDWFQGTPEGSLTRGRALVDVINAVGYDAVIPGNHDYDIGKDGLRELIADLKAPVLGSNTYEANTGRPVEYLRPYIVKTVGGVKVGIFGLQTTHMRSLAFEKNIAGLEFRDEVESARAAVSALQSAGAEVVIALSHLGYEEPGKPPFTGDRTLAAKVPGIDLIVGGHSHTPLFDPVAASTAPLIVQAGSNLGYLGRVVLEIDPATHKVVSKKGALVKLWEDQFGQDEDMAEVAGKYEKEVGKALDVVIATSTAFLGRERQRESSIGDWVTDCTRDWAHTQIAFQNGGGIRADMPAGPVRLRDIFEIMPFDNYVATLYLKGSQLRAILERGVSGAAGMLQMSGLRLTYDPGAPVGHRVSEVFVGQEPLKDDAEYSVAAPDFIVQGGDAYTAFADNGGAFVTSTLVRDVLTSCARQASPIEAGPLDRIIAQ